MLPLPSSLHGTSMIVCHANHPRGAGMHPAAASRSSFECSTANSLCSSNSKGDAAWSVPSRKGQAPECFFAPPPQTPALPRSSSPSSRTLPWPWPCHGAAFAVSCFLTLLRSSSCFHQDLGGRGWAGGSRGVTSSDRHWWLLVPGLRREWEWRSNHH